MVIKVPRVVADLVDCRGHVGGQAIIFLQIDREVGRRLFPNRPKGFGVLVAVDGNPHHPGPGLGQGGRLPGGGLHVRGLRSAHALDHDRVAGANRYGANTDSAGRVARQVQSGILGLRNIGFCQGSKFMVSSWGETWRLSQNQEEEEKGSRGAAEDAENKEKEGKRERRTMGFTANRGHQQTSSFFLSHLPSFPFFLPYTFCNFKWPNYDWF